MPKGVSFIRPAIRHCCWRWVCAGCLIFWVTGISCGLPGLRLDAQDNLETPENSSDSWSIEECLVRINAATSRERQQASRHLTGYGDLAIEPLIRAVDTASDREKARFLTVLNELALSEDESLASQALQSLESVSKKANDPVAADWARAILDRMGTGRQELAIGELTALGAEVESISQPSTALQDISYQVVFGESWQGNNQDLARLRWIARPTRVRLTGERINDGSVEIIAGHPNIRNLRIRDAAISNQAIQELANATRMNHLQIQYCSIDDGCIEDLRKLTHLDGLMLYGTGITDEGIASLGDSPGFGVDYRMGAYLGIRYELENSALRVEFVDPGSAADIGGLQVGDIIARYGDMPVTVAADFGNSIIRNRAGDAVPITIRRDGEEFTREFRLGKYPPRFP